MKVDILIFVDCHQAGPYVDASARGSISVDAGTAGGIPRVYRHPINGVRGAAGPLFEWRPLKEP